MHGADAPFADFNIAIPGGPADRTITATFTPTNAQFQVGFFSGVEADTNAQLDSIRVSSLSPPPATGLMLRIQRVGSVLDFSWPSRDGFQYDLRGAGSLLTPRSSWPLLQGDMEATPPLNQLQRSAPVGRLQYFSLEERGAP